MLRDWIIYGLICLVSSFGGGSCAYDHVISEQRDHKVLLSCPIDFKSCGELHSVKWFKGSARIAVVSGDGEVAAVKDEFMSRMSIDHQPKGPFTSLSIKSLQIADEDVYTCESTFLEPRESCDTSGVYRIDLKVEVPPSAVHILDDSNKFVKNGTKYGPLREGDKLKSICEVKATRPIPTVTWYRGGKRLTDSTDVHQENGLFYVKSELLLILSRLELGNNIECRVESPSLDDEIISNFIILDMEVPPTYINLTGVEHHTVQGTNVLLQCQVYGARPAVTISWFNSSKEIDIRQTNALQIETKSIEQRDGTYETTSELKFVATRFEDGVKFRCEAQNTVMREKKDKPLHESLALEVLYPPVVSVKPENLTVTEGHEALLFCEYEANPATLVNVKWYQNGKQLNLTYPDRYEGGNPEHAALLLKKSARFDDGAYTCELANVIGAEMSDNEIYLEVQFPPVVNLTMEPDIPMIENDEGNVTLYCNVQEGNPPILSKVRWFLGGELLKELPECSGDGSDELCNIDPSRLLLQNIGRQFLGNYSCEGFNSAGWGSRSKESELIVYYEPGNATVQHNPLTAVKRKSVSFTCSVDDPGFPAANTFHWLRGGRVVHEVTSNLYTVDPVGLDSRTNFTCYAVNAGGNGIPDTVLLDVHAAPAFINPLMPYTGVLYSTDNASLTCRVECVPECSISWFKDGIGLDESSDKYYITQKYLEADPATGDFESVLSVLNFNMTSWHQGKFDIYADNANYSCVSTNNSAGAGVRSATYFGIEYPPENTTVSKDIITVEEDNIPERILCAAKGNPEPLYEWQFNGSVITRGSALIINHKMAKSDAGPYECVSYNKHGRHSALTSVKVIYKPTCEIARKEIDNEDTLICIANGNPKEADFQWSIKLENDSVELGGGRIDGESSFLILDDEFSVTRIYRCVANNSVGAGPYCQIEVAGHLSWWQRWDKITLIILVASVLGVLLAVIALCCAIICICRRRRRRDKYNTDVSISATQSVLSYQASPPPPLPPQNTPTTTHRITPEIPKSPPKWPLRPGVMVHVKGNTKQILCANRTNQSVSPKAPHLSASLQTNALLTAPTIPQNFNSNRNEKVQNQPKSLPSSSSLSSPLCNMVAPVTHGNGIGGSISVESEHLKADDKVTAHPHPNAKLSGKIGVTDCPDRMPWMADISANSNILTGERNDVEKPPPLPKRNLLPPSRNSTNANNISECSTNELLPRKCKKRRNKSGPASPSDEDNDEEDSSIGCRRLETFSNDTEPKDPRKEQNFTDSAASGGLFEKIFGEIFNRQTQSYRAHSGAEAHSKSSNISSHIRNLFGTSRVFRRKRLERCDSGASDPFAVQHRLKGIRCSGVITYKRPPETKSGMEESTDEIRSTAVAEMSFLPGIESNNNSSRQINNKSSALGDPLTEPGEYENLPFHGLQTAPNKFATTPSINLNNSNVVRVAPRPKQVTNNVATNINSYAQSQQLQQQSYPLTHSTLLKQSYPLTSSQTMLLSASNANNTHSCANSNSAGNMANSSSSVSGGGHSRQYSLSNCFPTSYTAYYQHQQKQKGSDNCPYTVHSQSPSDNSHNPFVVQDLCKFNTNSSCKQNGTQRKKPPDPNKKFYSLKSLGNRKNGGLYFCRPSLSSSKCKRHHSFAGGSVGDVITSENCVSLSQNGLPLISQQKSDPKIKFYEPPLYENLTDSIQIHDSSVGSSRLYGTHPSYRHHHQNIEDASALEPERLSIYRSDSGISNSSYECITPVPAPRQLLKRKSMSSHSTKCQNYSPLYMNVTNNASSRCNAGRTTPSTALPPSSSAGCTTKTSSQSSCMNTSSNCASSNINSNNGNGSHCNGGKKCNQPNNNNSKDTMDSSCHQLLQQDLKRNCRLQSQQHQQQESQHAKHGSSSRNRWKKRSQNNSASLASLELTSKTSTIPILLPGTSSSSSGFNSLNGQGGGASSSSSSSTMTNRCSMKSHQQQQQQKQLPVLTPEESFEIVPMNSTSSYLSDHASHYSSHCYSSGTHTHHTANSTKTLTALSRCHNVYNSDNNLTDSYNSNDIFQKKSYCKTSGYVIRPMKLPLRKHHSFHFQPSQTVSGSITPSSRKTSRQRVESNYHSDRMNNYKLSGGPLVFKPLLNERTAFKPIVPAKSSVSNHTSVSMTADSNKTPRICGTSLKRHMSNVECFDSSRYKNRLSTSPELSLEEEDNSANDNDDLRVDIEMCDDEDIDEIIIMQEEDLPSSSSNSTIVDKQSAYADRHPQSYSSNLQSNLNIRSLSSIASDDNHRLDQHVVDDFEDLAIYSDSEQFRKNTRVNRPFFYISKQPSFDQSHSPAFEKPNLGTPVKFNKNQFSTLAKNEPLSPADLAGDFDYADIDYRSYGPINYKAASIYALVKKEKNNSALKEVENNIK